MCEIIQFKTRARAQAPTQNSLPSMIDVYAGKNGKTGIDACVSAAVAAEMHGTEFLPGMQSYFRGDNGMIGFDAQVSAPVAERMLFSPILLKLSAIDPVLSTPCPTICGMTLLCNRGWPVLRKDRGCYPERCAPI
jgi:hypothetical protein